MASLELAALSQVLQHQLPESVQRLQQYVQELEVRVATLERERISPHIRRNGNESVARVCTATRAIVQASPRAIITRSLSRYRSSS